MPTSGLSRIKVDDQIMKMLRETDECKTSLLSQGNCDTQEISGRLNQLVKEMGELFPSINKASKERKNLLKKLCEFINYQINEALQLVRERIEACAFRNLQASEEKLDNSMSTTPTSTAPANPAPSMQKLSRKEVLESQVRHFEGLLEDMELEQQLAEEQEFITQNCLNIESWDIVKKIGDVVNGTFVIVKCNKPDHPKPEKNYALKIFHNIDYKEVNYHLKNEFKECAKLPFHPNVIKFLGATFVDVMNNPVYRCLPTSAQLQPREAITPNKVVDRKTLYLLGDHDNDSLKDHLKRRAGRFSSEEISQMIKHLGEALLFLEKHQLIHADVKLDNFVVILTKEGKIRRCKIIDFGSSLKFGSSIKLSLETQKGEPGKERWVAKMKISESGDIESLQWGNQNHIAPELHTALKQAQRTHQKCELELDYSHQPAFALGILVYELVTDQEPIPGYPEGCEDPSTGCVSYSDDNIKRIPFEGDGAVLNKRQSDLIYRAVSCVPGNRPTLQELVDAFSESTTFDLISQPSTPDELEEERILEIKIDELKRRIDLLDHELNHRFEKDFMSAVCNTTTVFEVFENECAIIDKNKDEIYGLELSARCKERGHPFPEKRYALKASMVFGKSTQTFIPYAIEQNALNSFPPHPNITRFICSFSNEVTDTIRQFIPDSLKKNTQIMARGVKPRNRSTDYFVTERAQERLSTFLEKYPEKRSVKTLRLCIAQVGSALSHLEKHYMVHHQLTLENIGIELEDSNGTPNIKKFILTNFSMACQLNQKQCFDTNGNIINPHPSLLAPEVINGYRQARAALSRSRSRSTSSSLQGEPHESEVSYSTQYVFELGCLAYLVLTNKGPLVGYPDEYTGNTGVVYKNDVIPLIEQLNEYSDLQAMVLRSVACNPKERPTLEELINAFKEDAAIPAKNDDTPLITNALEENNLRTSSSEPTQLEETTSSAVPLHTVS